MFDRDDCPEHGHRDNRGFDVSEALRADYTTGVANSKADPAIYHTYPRRSTRGSTSLSQPHAFRVPNVFGKRAAHVSQLRTQLNLSILNAFISTKAPLN
jgi:hypothetical protein